MPNHTSNYSDIDCCPAHYWYRCGGGRFYIKEKGKAFATVTIQGVRLTSSKTEEVHDQPLGYEGKKLHIPPLVWVLQGVLTLYDYNWCIIFKNSEELKSSVNWWFM